MRHAAHFDTPAGEELLHPQKKNYFFQGAERAERTTVHDDLPQRKSQHLDLVQRKEVEPEGADPLLHCVRLVHRALPELSLDGIDRSAELCGRPLKAPLMITGMTGGTDRAAQINRDLAALAQEMGVAFGVGSMRILLEQPELLPTFAVKPSRPPLLLANLGAQQLAQRGPDAALRLIELLGADGICIHLNPAQELVQDGGDRAFRGCLDAIGAIVRAPQQGGVEAARATLRAIIDAVRAAFLLCGARNLVALRATRPVLLEPLKSWIEGLAG